MIGGFAVGGVNGSGFVSGTSPSPLSKSPISSSSGVVINTSTDAPCPVILKVSVSTSSILLSSSIPIVTFAVLSLIIKDPLSLFPTMSRAVIPPPVKL